jgi:Fe-S-cluster-containing dehydrogenase component
MGSALFRAYWTELIILHEFVRHYFLNFMTTPGLVLLNKMKLCVKCTYRNYPSCFHYCPYHLRRFSSEGNRELCLAPCAHAVLSTYVKPEMSSLCPL